VFRKRLPLPLLVKNASDHVLQLGWADQIAKCNLREGGRDKIREVSTRSRDRGDLARDWLTSRGFDDLLELIGQGAVPLTGRLGGHLHRHGVEGGVVAGGVATHKRLDVLT
jgi:hypothetical protein